MKKFIHLALAAALMTSSAVGAATFVPTQAQAAERPWLIMTYIKNGQNVGNTQVFCESPAVDFGDTSNYDYIHYDYYFMCP